jgi:hypothetical protein
MKTHKQASHGADLVRAFSSGPSIARNTDQTLERQKHIDQP